MSSAQSIFKSWLPNSLIIALLVFCIFPHVMLITIFNMNSTFTASFLDIEVDDLQFIFGIGYATIVCAMFFYHRLFETFSPRNYLILMTVINIVLLLGIVFTNNQQVVMILRFLQGPLSIFEGRIILPILIARLKSPHAKLMTYSILYGYIMTADKINTSLVKFAIQHYSYDIMMMVLIGMHLMALFIFLIIFNANRMFPKKPLYQMHIIAGIFMSIALIAGAYFFTYGKKYEWFDSPRMFWSLAICIFFSGLFIIYQKTVRRPIYHFEILKSPRIRYGIILFFTFYILRASMSNIYQVMQEVWLWHWEYVLDIQYYNLAGTVFGVVVGYYLLSRLDSYKIVFATGFAFMTVSMYWFSFVFTLDITIPMIAPPLVIEGIGQGILFTPIVFYMIGAVHPPVSGNALLTGTATRFWGSVVGYALMQNALFYFNKKNQYSLSQYLTQTNPIYQEQMQALFAKHSANYLPNEALQLSVKTMYKTVSNHALLLSNIEIFHYLSLLGLLMFIAIVFWKPTKDHFNLS